ncbi:HK97 gp10 family phage protein [Cytobacillus solani]|uniref:HK97 gp10 family phage protein n=1 Tax=Cytobacillus solani TaxID=1637975 RepID=UPI00207AC5DA|nr:HK97 gp10 family phage protein [Cytobacillus solani]USK54373.1 HK97 gp10 family phage protein [Cytobacillus solani]
MRIDGLSDFQRDLLDVAERKLPKEIPKVLRKIGSKARTNVAKKARREVKKRTGNYSKGWKRGKVFKNGRNVLVRVYNGSPHAHLIEDGHRQVTADGREVGFVPGKKVLEKSMIEFDNSGQVSEIVGEWLDDLLRKGKL